MLLKNNDFYFKGTQSEDLIYIIQNFKYIFLGVLGFYADSPRRGENEGGNNSSYADLDFYISLFYTVIIRPDAIIIQMNFKNKNRSRIIKPKNKLFPKILSSRWKK